MKKVTEELNESNEEAKDTSAEKINKNYKEEKDKDTKEIILEKSAKEYFLSGEDELKKERFNSAVVLFFKSLVSFIDLFIFQQINSTPSSHTERFRILEKKFPDIYNIIDKDFPFYQDSYVQIMSKELAEVIKEDAKTMADKTEIKL